MPLTNEERRLLKHYSDRVRVIQRPERTQAHQQLVALGFIMELCGNDNTVDLTITVTNTGQVYCGKAA